MAQSLRDLDTSLRELHSRLIVLRGNPKDELPRILGEWDVQRLAYETDIEPYAKSRDGEINQLAATAGVELVTRVGHTLCDPDALLRRAGGTTTTTYSSFLNHFEQVTPPHLARLARPPRLSPHPPRLTAPTPPPCHPAAQHRQHSTAAQQPQQPPSTSSSAPCTSTQVCNNKDFTPEAWDYMRNKGFFGMKIPKVDTPNRP